MGYYGPMPPSKTKDPLLRDALEAGYRRDYPRAVVLLTELLGKTDRFPQALLYLGRSCHALGNYGRAIQSFTAYLRRRPGSPIGSFFLGRTYLALGMYPAAIRHLKRSVKDRPDLTAAYGLIGFALLKTRRFQQALRWLRAALEASPGDKRILNGYLNAALVAAIRLFHRGRHVEAGGLFQEVLRHREKTLVAHLYLAAIYRELGKDNVAIFHLESASQIAPSDPVIHLQKGWLLLKTGDRRAALAEITAGARLVAPGITPTADLKAVQRLLTYAHFHGEHWAEAIRHAKKLLRENYDDPRLHVIMAESYRALGEFGKAMNHYRRALEGEPSSREIRYGLLLALWELGQFTELITVAEQLLRMDGADAIGQYYRILGASRAGGSPQDLIPMLQEAIRSRGPDRRLMSALAEAYLESGLPALAEGWFLRVLKSGGNDRDALRSLARAYGELGRKEEEREVLARYVLQTPEDAGARRTLLRLLLSVERFSDAAVEVEALLAGDPGNRRLREILAACQRRGGNPGAALLTLKELLREYPHDGEYAKAVAWCLEKAGNRGQAVRFLRAFLSAHPEEANVLIVLGVLLFHEGDKEKAAETFRAAIALSPGHWKAYRNLGMVYRATGNMEFADRFLARAEELRNAAGDSEPP
jgi:tetratricopeptide (TPR) repeat protein